MKTGKLMGWLVSISFILMMNFTTNIYGVELSEHSDKVVTEGVCGYTEVRAKVVVGTEQPPEDTPKPEGETSDIQPSTGESYSTIMLIVVLLLSGIAVVAAKLYKIEKQIE